MKANVRLTARHLGKTISDAMVTGVFQNLSGVDESIEKKAEKIFENCGLVQSEIYEDYTRFGKEIQKKYTDFDCINEQKFIGEITNTFMTEIGDIPDKLPIPDERMVEQFYKNRNDNRYVSLSDCYVYDSIFITVKTWLESHSDFVKDYSNNLHLLDAEHIAKRVYYAILAAPLISVAIKDKQATMTDFDYSKISIDIPSLEDTVYMRETLNSVDKKFNVDIPLPKILHSVCVSLLSDLSRAEIFNLIADYATYITVGADTKENFMSEIDKLKVDLDISHINTIAGSTIAQVSRLLCASFVYPDATIYKLIYRLQYLYYYYPGYFCPNYAAYKTFMTLTRSRISPLEIAENVGNAFYYFYSAPICEDIINLHTFNKKDWYNAFTFDNTATVPSTTEYNKILADIAPLIIMYKQLNRQDSIQYVLNYTAVNQEIFFNAKLAAQTSTIKQANVEIDKLKSEIEKQQRKNKEKTDEIVALKTEISNRVAAAPKETETARNDNSSTILLAENERLKAEQATYNTALTKAKTYNTSLQMKVAAFEKDKQISNNEIARLTAEIAKLSEALKESREANANLINDMQSVIMGNTADNISDAQNMIPTQLKFITDLRLHIVIPTFLKDLQNNIAELFPNAEFKETDIKKCTRFGDMPLIYDCYVYFTDFASHNEFDNWQSRTNNIADRRCYVSHCGLKSFVMAVIQHYAKQYNVAV